MENDGLIVGVLSSVLMRLIAINNKCGNNMLPVQPVTKFQSSYPPDVSIESYLSRIHKYAKCSESCFIVALIFIDRIIEKKNLVLSNLNIHRIVIASVLISAKFMDDFFYNNAFYAKLGGISTQEMNALELEVLLFLEFSLNVSTDVYASYYSELKSYVNADKIIPNDTLLYRSITNVVPPSRSPFASQMSELEIENSLSGHQIVSPSIASQFQMCYNVHNINLSIDSSIALKRSQCQTLDDGTLLVSHLNCPEKMDCNIPLNYCHHDCNSMPLPTLDNLTNPNFASHGGLMSTHDLPFRRVTHTDVVPNLLPGIRNHEKEIHSNNFDIVHHQSNFKNFSESEDFIGHAEQCLKRSLNFNISYGYGFVDSTFTQPVHFHRLRQPVQSTDDSDYYHKARYRLQPQDQLQQDFVYDENCSMKAHHTITPSYVNVSPSFLQNGNIQLRDISHSASPSRSDDSNLGEFNHVYDFVKIQQSNLAPDFENHCCQVHRHIAGSSIGVSSLNVQLPSSYSSASTTHPLITKNFKPQKSYRHSTSTRSSFSEKLPALSGHLPLLF